MQVEHKTEKGTVLFQKLLIKSTFIQFEKDFNRGRLKFMKNKGWRLIGLTSEVREDQCEMMVDIIWNGFKNYELSDGNVGNYKRLVKSAVDSFKSLMQHLQVYEYNPYSHYINPEDFDNDAIEHAQELSKFVGKWVVLFKPN